MKQQSHFYWITSCVLLVCLGAPAPTQAQIIPDKSLPTNSAVKSERNIRTITGGTVSGGNLFHSFEQFSLRSGNVAFFDNALKIRNIISRVTGTSISEIDGLIQANGTANLFLLNPNGIIFGPNASLKIGGSFLASTASGLDFDGTTLFSATTPQATPLLTMSVPTGLQFGSSPGVISVEESSLEVQPNKTLALVGGNVRLKGGNLRAEGGRVELGGVAGPGKVRLDATNNNLRLSFPGNVLRENVSLANNAVIDVSAERGGSAAISGRNVSFTGGSSVMSDTSGPGKGRGILVQASESIVANGTQLLSRSGEGLAGDIILNAQDKVSLANRAGIDSSTIGSGKSGRILVQANDSVSIKNFSSISNDTFEQGEGNDIQIKTGSLFVTNADVAITSSTYAEGAAGGVVINARDQVSLSNGSIFSTTIGPGEGGDITVNAQSLSLSNGARLSAVATKAGNAGNIQVNTSDSVSISGINSDSGVASELLTRTSASGKGGNIKVVTDTFRLEDGAVLDARTQAKQHNAGDAGNITVETGIFRAADGGQIITTTLGSGDAGNITITAAEDATLSGNNTGLFANTGKNSTGDGGDVTIKANKRLTLENGARIEVSSLGEGRAGRLFIDPGLIRLDRGTLAAETARGEGGDIFLQVGSLQLRNNSLISTKAGNDGDGGNITINADTLVGIENSDIRADANQGEGGIIKITAQGIFGLEVRDKLTENSDITAFSQADPSLNGVVEINTPDVDPDEQVVDLPEEVVDVSGLVTQSCPVGGSTVARGSSEFVVTGRGGLPPTPGEALKSDTVLVDLGTPIVSSTEQPPVSKRLSPVTSGQVTPEEPLRREGRTENRSSPAVSANSTHSASVPITEAQGWVVGPNGEVVLTAQAPTVTPHNSELTSAVCHGS